MICRKNSRCSLAGHVWIFKDGGGVVANRVQLFAVPWTVGRQAPLSMGFPRPNTGAGCHAFSRGTHISALAGKFFTTEAPEKPLKTVTLLIHLHISGIWHCAWHNSRGSLSAGWLGLEPWHLVAQNQRRYIGRLAKSMWIHRAELRENHRRDRFLKGKMTWVGIRWEAWR